MTTHELKTWPKHFAPIADSLKRAELRKNDRDFKIGDWIKFMEWDPEEKEYTGNIALASIVHIADGEPIPKDYVLLSLGPPGR